MSALKYCSECRQDKLDDGFRVVPTANGRKRPVCPSCYRLVLRRREQARKRVSA
jgi:transposase-like protein